MDINIHNKLNIHNKITTPRDCYIKK